jgi:hypothetical protein
MENISKYDILNLLSKKMPFFQATQWLKGGIEKYDGKSPSELMKENKNKEAYEELQKYLKKKNIKT